MGLQRVEHDLVTEQQPQSHAQTLVVGEASIAKRLVLCELFSWVESHESFKFPADSKFIWKCKEAGISKAAMKKNKIVGLTLPDFKT